MHKVQSNIHTHTKWSDGKSTPEEMIGRAMELGFHTLGISDHSFTYFDPTYCFNMQDVPGYLHDLRGLKERYAGKIDLQVGYELDAFCECDPSAFDYLISGNHYVEKDGIFWGIDHSAAQTERAVREGFGGDWHAMEKRYFGILAERTARSGAPVCAHFDLITKFRQIDTDDAVYRALALEALDAVLDAGMLIEVNTGAIARGYRTTPYPAPFLLKRVLERGGRVILGSDCHNRDFLDCAFAQAEEFLLENGFTHVTERRGAVFAETALR